MKSTLTESIKTVKRQKRSINSLLVIIALFASGTVSAALVSHWTSDGNALDSVGSVNGTLIGNTGYATGEFGDAFSFDGNGDYVELGVNPSLQFTSSMTMSAWVNPTAYSDYQIIINYENAYEVAIAGGTIRYALWNSSPGWAWIDTGISVALNEWTGFAISYDGSNINTYNGDGNLVHTRAGSGNIRQESNYTLRIGARSGPSYYFNGLIDDVRLYDSAESGIESSVVAAIPGPATFALLGLGLVGIGFSRKRQRKLSKTQIYNKF
jgi:hypothetical protein